MKVKSDLRGKFSKNFIMLRKGFITVSTANEIEFSCFTAYLATYKQKQSKIWSKFMFFFYFRNAYFHLLEKFNSTCVETLAKHK